jgi:acetate kinase
LADWTRSSSQEASAKTPRSSERGSANELGFLGIELDKKRNAKNAPLISVDGGRVRVRVIRTNEEVMIARSVTRVLNLGSIRKT